MEVYTSFEVCSSAGVYKVAAVQVLFGAHRPVGALMMFGVQMMTVGAYVLHGESALAGALRRFGAHMNMLVGVLTTFVENVVVCE